ncbi:MAG: hypothetical protein J5372_06035 [Lachnospiraceae bacterium]|nr:hypothetical protein [Lachnospiraceae bacterium]
MKKRIKILLTLLLTCMVIIFETVGPAWAAEDGTEDGTEYEPFIVVSSYRVTDDIITPGKKFDLIIEVENTDTKVATRGSIVTINFPEGISTSYGSSNQMYLKSLKPGEKREITFELYASPYYSRSSVPFGINISSELRTSSATIYAPLLLDLSAFKVVSQTIPEEAGIGEKIAASLSFKSLMQEKLSNVVLSVYVDDDTKPVATANIGNISAEASKTQNITFFINEKGQHSVRFELSYSFAEGDYSSAELYSGTIQINDSVDDNELLANSIQEEKLSGQDKLIIGGCLGLSLLLGIGIVLIVKKYN